MAVSEAHREAVLASHFLLRHLPKPVLRDLATSVQFASYPRHATIFQKGDPGSSMMAVVRGRVKICTYSKDGKEVVLNIIDRDKLFGEIAVLDGRPRTADAVALEETDLMVLQRNQLMTHLTGNPEIAAKLFGILCQRLRQTSEYLEDALLREAPSRLARGLLRLADTFGRPGPKGTQLSVKLSQQQIGSLIGISRESVNKLLNEWMRSGEVEMLDGYLLIPDRAALERLAEATEA
jgi:CRP-like cAMP-binding protein